MQKNYLQINKCPLCSCKTHKFNNLNIESYAFGIKKINIPRKIKIKECLNCGLFYKDLIPTKIFLKKIFNVHASSVWREKKLSYKYEKKQINQIFKDFNKKLNFIDFGCGSGDFINSIKKNNIIVSGVDVYKYERLKYIINGEFFNTFIEDKIISKYKYDLFTFFDIFEHLYSPNDLISNVINISKKNNSFIYIETGSSESVKNIGDWWYAKLFEHHIFWNLKSIKYLCKKNNLEIINYSIKQHKERMYMNKLKKLILFSLYFGSKLTFLNKILTRITKKDLNLVGNVYIQDHFQCILKIK